jgi:hypothetical protein
MEHGCTASPDAPPAKFPYSTVALDLSNPEIRLVELQRNDQSNKPTCILRSYPIDGPHPLSIALSYAWGENVRFADIDLNGQPFPVGQNLWHFLEEMRWSGRYNTYWIDAICINQGDIWERNHQVQMMQQIYSNADSVSV